MGKGDATCHGCHAAVWFCTVLKIAGGTARMILNPHPDPTGNVAVRVTETGGKVGRVLPKGTQPTTVEQLYTPHHATCPKPPPRKPKPAPAKPPAPAPQPALFPEGDT